MEALWRFRQLSWLLREAGDPLTPPVGDVPADEGLLLPPVQQTGAFQQQGRGQHVARDRGQDIHSSTHPLQVCWEYTHVASLFT